MFFSLCRCGELLSVRIMSRRALTMDVRILAFHLALGLAVVCLGADLSHAAAAESRQAAETFLKQGLDELKQNHYDRAMRLFSEAVRKDPEQAHALKLRAKVHEHLGRLQLAVKDYDRYLALRPSDPDAYFRRADLLNRTLDHESAIQDYTRGLKLKPSSAGALVGRGLAQVALERYSEAIEDYRLALQLDPANGEVMGNMAIAYLLSGNNGKASEYLKKALRTEQDPGWKIKLESWLEHLKKRRSTKETHIPPAGTPPTSTKPLW